MRTTEELRKTQAKLDELRRQVGALEAKRKGIGRELEEKKARKDYKLTALELKDFEKRFAWVEDQLRPLKSALASAERPMAKVHSDIAARAWKIADILKTARKHPYDAHHLRKASDAMQEWDRISKFALEARKLHLGGKSPDYAGFMVDSVNAAQAAYESMVEWVEKAGLKSKDDKHNRRSKERAEIEKNRAKYRADLAKWRSKSSDAPAEKPRREGKHFRSLGLTDAEGVGVAMVAHAMSLSDIERSRFLGTTNVLGFTQAAVDKYEEMLRQRDQAVQEATAAWREREARGREQMETTLRANRSSCFPVPAQITGRTLGEREGKPATRTGVIAVPFTSAEVLEAVRQVHAATPAPGACARGVTGVAVHIASRVARAMQQWEWARGWVAYPSGDDPSSPRLHVHLPSRIDALFGDVRGLEETMPAWAKPLDLTTVSTSYDALLRMQPQRPVFGGAPAAPLSRAASGATANAESASRTGAEYGLPGGPYAPADEGTERYR